MKRFFCLLLSLLLAFIPLTVCAGEEDAAFLSPQCSYTSSITRKYWQSALTDKDADTHVRFPAGSEVTVSWEAEVPAAALYMEWNVLPQGCLIRQYGESGTLLLEAEADGRFLNNALTLEQGTRRVQLLAVNEIDLLELHIYGEGTIGGNYHAWADTPEKLDFLVVAMHPDDDALFMGAVYPIYGAEKGYTGTILYMATRTRLRCTEALNGAYVMGLRAYPILSGFPDIPSTMSQEVKNTFTEDMVVEYLVETFRRYKPLVVVSHDLNGEYGHWQHKLLAAAVLKAASLSQDAAAYPDSAERWGVWQVQKVYLHLYPENRLELETDLPLTAFGGKTAYEIAALAYQCHASQQTGVHLISDTGEYGVRYFGLAYTAVGTDTGSNDLFENIDPAMLVNPPENETPPPETKAPSALPLVAASPASDTAAPAASAVASAVTQTASPAPASQKEKSSALAPCFIAGAILVLLLLGAAVYRSLRQR